jgi:hypothetical protein
MIRYGHGRENNMLSRNAKTFRFSGVDSEDNRGNGRSPGYSGGSIVRLFPEAI